MTKADKANEQTEELVEEQAEEESEEELSEFIEVNVDGVDLKIERKKLGSWKQLTLIKRTVDAEQAWMKAPEEKRSIAYGTLIDALIELITFVLGDNMDAVMEHLGELASLGEVRAFYRKTMEATSAKN